MVVRKLAPGGAAESCGEIQPDDVILTVLPQLPTVFLAPPRSPPCRRAGVPFGPAGVSFGRGSPNQRRVSEVGSQIGPPSQCIAEGQRGARRTARAAAAGCGGSGKSAESPPWGRAPAVFVHSRLEYEMMVAMRVRDGVGQVDGVAVQTTEAASRAVLGAAGTEVSHRRGRRTQRRPAAVRRSRQAGLICRGRHERGQAGMRGAWPAGLLPRRGSCDGGPGAGVYRAEGC